MTELKNKLCMLVKDIIALEGISSLGMVDEEVVRSDSINARLSGRLDNETKVHIIIGLTKEKYNGKH